MKNETGNNNMNKKPSKRKYIITAACFGLLLSIALVVAALNNKSVPDPVSERIIREAAAKELGKDVNDLTNEDFAKIIKIELSGNELSNITLLEQFTNMEKLYLIRIVIPENRIPKWIKFLDKLGVSGPKNSFALDLSPLKKLNNLKMLLIVSCDDITGMQAEELQKALPKLEITRGDMLD